MFVLAHLSDAHLAPLPQPRPGELTSKRLLGYLNWIRKRRAIHRRDVLAKIVDDLHRAQADHVAVTGDLVNIALPAEFEHARSWLNELGPPSRVSLVPGNHDAYVAEAAPLRARLWAPYMAGDDPSLAAARTDTPSTHCEAPPSPRARGEGRGEGALPPARASQAQTRGEAPSPGAGERADLSPHAGRGGSPAPSIRAESDDGADRLHPADGNAETFPFLRIRGPVALVGVSTGVPTAPFMATGQLGADQIARMTTLLAATPAHFRVVLIHHPPHVVPTSPAKRLVDGAAFAQAIAAAGAELVIHGHNHVRSLAFMDGPRRRVPVVGVPSASAAYGADHDPAGYALYRIDGKPGAWTCEVIRRALDAGGTVSEGERLAV